MYSELFSTEPTKGVSQKQKLYEVRQKLKGKNLSIRRTKYYRHDKPAYQVFQGENAVSVRMTIDEVWEEYCND